MEHRVGCTHWQATSLSGREQTENRGEVRRDECLAFKAGATYHLDTRDAFEVVTHGGSIPWISPHHIETHVGTLNKRPRPKQVEHIPERFTGKVSKTMPRMIVHCTRSSLGHRRAQNTVESCNDRGGILGRFLSRSSTSSRRRNQKRLLERACADINNAFDQFQVHREYAGWSNAAVSPFFLGIEHLPPPRLS